MTAGAEREDASGASEAGEAVWTVTCLCAAWCGVCRDYQATFERLAAEHPGVAFRWSDIEEDEAEADVDVETFPTLRVSCDGVERFFGPVLPQARHLSSLLRSLMGTAAGQRPQG